MKLIVIVAGCMIVAMVSQAATAAGMVINLPNPNAPAKPPAATPAPVPPRTMVIKFVDVKPGSFMGKSTMILTGTQIEGGAKVHLAIWTGSPFPRPAPGTKPAPATRPAKPLPDPAIMSVLQNANPGDCLLVNCIGVSTRLQARQVQPYELKPGEDQPNVYLYVDKEQEKIGDVFRKNVTVSRLGETFTMVVPTVDGQPSSEIMQVIDGATANETLLEIISAKVGANATIKTVKVYEPPKEFVFVKVAAQKDLTAIEVKDGDKTQTIAINPKAGNSAVLLKKIKDFKADQAVMVRSTKDDDGTWLLDIKAKEVKPSPTSKPG